MRGSEGRPRVALLTYSTKPRGGVVHTLYLAESLHRLGEDVHVFALGDPDEGFFRPTGIPHTIVPAPRPEGTLEERVFRALDRFREGLAGLVPRVYDIVHAQDCIAARVASRLGEADPHLVTVRTVHHVDDFTTPALVDCQRRSILEPDHVLVVSQFWRRALRQEYGVEAGVVTNGVDEERFRRHPGSDWAALRSRVGAQGRVLFLTVGGLEPRKGSLELVEALALVKAAVDPSPVLAVVGGHSFQDHDPYRERVLARADALGLGPSRDLVMLGTVPDAELPCWYWAADALAFPSVKEGFGLAVLEAMAAGLPVVVTDIPVFREYLDEEVALFVPPGDPQALAAALIRLALDPRERERLARAGPGVAARFTWEATARQHGAIYRHLIESRSASRGHRPIARTDPR